MRAYRLFLLRHGLTQGNLEGRYIGRTDVPLSPRGEEELHHLAEEYEYPTVGRLYTSPLQRCVQTAKILYPAMSVCPVEQLTEYDFGDYEGKTAAQLQDDPAFFRWLKSGMAETPPGGESSQDFQARLREGIDWVIRDMMHRKISDAALITHGGVLMTLLAMCGLPQRRMLEWTVGNGKGYAALINASLWGNTGKFEVCDPLPYGNDFSGDHRLYEMLDVDVLRQQAKEEAAGRR